MQGAVRVGWYFPQETIVSLLPVERSEPIRRGRRDKPRYTVEHLLGGCILYRPRYQARPVIEAP
jgi:hypothetical protein